MISVVIIVKNGERCLKGVLDAAKNFPEIIVYDTGSNDKTLDIAACYSNVRIIQAPFIGFGKTHNAASDVATHDWILSIDSDEVLSAELTNEILSIPFNPQTVYSLPFRNFFNGKWIKCCGWHPESHIRLYNKKMTRFSESLVHEGVIKNGLCEISLKHPVYHYPYASISDFLIKMERYSTLFAEERAGKKGATLLTAITHGAAAFVKSYFIKKGFLGGFEGFLISIYNGHTAFYKYLKLYLLNKNGSIARPDVSQSR